jgi:branched-chain amino acid transport system substrate-binding protein
MSSPFMRIGGSLDGPRRGRLLVLGSAGLAVLLTIVVITWVTRGGSGSPATSGSLSPSPSGSSGALGSGAVPAGTTLVISTDLPLQGSSKDASESTNNAIDLYLGQIGYKAGPYTVKLQKYDDATAAAATWDTGQCQANAAAHVKNTSEVAVMGTFNTGCAKIEVPVLNQDPSGPMLMVSHANTNPGLTKKRDTGEPGKYYPTGHRNYARVVTTDEVQGTATAQLAAKDLGIKKLYLLNDNETYGQGIARQVASAAPAAGITVVGNAAWDANAKNYVSLFQSIKASGADAVYLSGVFDNNGGQLIKDKVAVLGKSTTVKLLAPDGFTGYPNTLDKMPETQGMYMTFPGITTDQVRARGGAGRALLDAYKAKYGADPASNHALYGVAAVQVIIEAIKKSNGTRKAVSSAVFSAPGITVPAGQSVLGVATTIDPSTGDVNAKDITVEVVKDSAETFLKTLSV